MTPLSAADAVTPAWRRTREILFAHRSYRLFFKLAAVATLAEASNGFNLNLGRIGAPFHSGDSNPLPKLAMATLVTAIIALVLVGLLIGLAIFYCGSCMQLAMVDVVGSRETRISPLWRKYGSLVWRWIGLKLLVFVSLMLGMAVLALPFILYFAFYASTHANQLDEHGGLLVAAILAIVAGAIVFLALILLFVAAFCLIADFVPAFMATENTSIRDSFRYLKELCRRETGQVFLYLVLRFILGLAFGMGFLFVILLAVLIAAIPLGGVGVGLYFLLHTGGAGAHAALITAAVVGGLIFAAWMLTVYISCVGVMGTFFRAYALYFLGGRFPSVGYLLDASTPQPVFAAPAYPPFPQAPFDPSQI